MNEIKRNERTGFQENAPFNPKIDLQTDFVMVYGIDESMPQRVAKWKSQGYIVHLMTGVAWGEYQNYLNGKVDGREHWDEGQINYKGKPVRHNPTVPYMVPTVSFSDFLTGRIKAAIDAGVEAVHMEEPEFWVDSGYSPAFKREWEIFYREPWQSPHESADAQYRASKLKAYLYARCLERVCCSLKEYAQVRYGRSLRFYVPTHSLINYTQWRIVSPESKLLDIPTIDGYIAQIWTGTSRSENVYHGSRKERTFETAYLEYGMMQELTRGTDRQMWFLHDPIEDNPNYTWAEYRRDYLKTLVASLLHPAVSHFEICPWPNRVFCGKYPDKTHSRKEEIPKEYAALLLTVMNTLRDMDQKDISWDNQQVAAGVFLADSAMYQRVYPGWQADASDGSNVTSIISRSVQDILDLSAFYGLTLPIVKTGIPVRPVQLDNTRRFAHYLDNYHVLVLSYEFMKPEHPSIHNALAQWVRNGGKLLYIGDGSDAFHSVREWWNTGDKKYATPFGHLLETLGLDENTSEGTYPVGKGYLQFWNIHPTQIANSAQVAEKYLDIFKNLCEIGNAGQKIRFQNYFLLRRGPYVIASVMEETGSSEPLQIQGQFVNLLQTGLPVTDEVRILPGEQTLLVDLQKLHGKCRLVASTMRVEAVDGDAGEFRYTVKGPQDVDILMLFKTESQPKQITATDADLRAADHVSWNYDPSSETVRIAMPAAEGSVDFQIAIEFA